MFVHHSVLGGRGGQKMVLDPLKVELYTNGCEEHAGKQTVVLCKRNRAESSLQLLTGVLKTHFDLFVTSET